MRFRFLLFLGLLAAAHARETVRLPAGLRVVAPSTVTLPECPLLASLQGRLNRDAAVLWLRSGGIKDSILADLAGEGVRLRAEDGVWHVLSGSLDLFSGFITCDVADGSLNVATSLARAVR